ncbi:HNH endonuclease [Phaeobacter italicus]|uniref:HNH endonuclease n=1 Tax=Phaeobacter italicus TaxID=481446 RepID=UPI002432424C|nr:HNH endonuclease signature motif containing protein [Phaeobacter italicus]MCI5102120.1 HNH endonuclease [Phaeobacter italicus]
MGKTLAELKELVFRQITPADFFNINKPPGTEDRGGGQSYIDVPVRNVDLDTWHSFFANVEPKETRSGPLWNVEINSLGNLGRQEIAIGQRRDASVNIRSQKLLSRSSNRVLAWHPDHGDFPRAPADMSSAEDPRVIELTAGVRIFILKTEQDDYWAGWLRTEEIQRLAAVDARFEEMLFEPAGHLSFDPAVELDVTSLKDPFGVQPHAATEAEAEVDAEKKPPKKAPYNAKAGRTEEAIAADLFQDDSSSEEVKKTQKVIETFERNRKAVRDLKRLYKTCQVTGDDFVFSKVNGEPYLEVHHLVPLGEGGSDDPANLVVISAHIHRMLHYAVVEGIDLSKIADDKLDFTINGETFTITWRPEHAKVISDAGGAVATA